MSPLLGVQVWEVLYEGDNTNEHEGSGTLKCDATGG